MYSEEEEEKEGTEIVSFSHDKEDVDLSERMIFENDIYTSIYDNQKLDYERYLNKVGNTKINIEIEDKQTSSKTNKDKKNERTDKEENPNKSTFFKISRKNGEIKNPKIFKIFPPIQYTYDKIKNEIAYKLENRVKFNEMFKIDENIQIIEKKMNDESYKNPKKRNRKNKKDQNEKKEKEQKEKNNLGRIKKNDNQKEGKHDCRAQDNVIKKIKSKLLFYLNQFINKILNNRIASNKIDDYIKIIKDKAENEKIPLIQELSYDEIVNATEKEKNLGYLEMPLKDFLSINISPKFSTFEPDSNKRIIKEILKNEDDEVIQFILREIKFEDWIDIFIYKKELTDFKSNLNKKQINEIMNNFKRIDYLIEDIYKEYKESEKSKKPVFTIFFILLYNYKRWYYIKEGRKKKINKNL